MTFQTDVEKLLLGEPLIDPTELAMINCLQLIHATPAYAVEVLRKLRRIKEFQKPVKDLGAEEAELHEGELDVLVTARFTPGRG